MPAGLGGARYFGAATGAASDVIGFCQRQALACDVGQAIAKNIESKFKYNFKLVYEWANPPPSSHGSSTTSDAEKKPPSLDTRGTREKSLSPSGAKSAS